MLLYSDIGILSSSFLIFSVLTGVLRRGACVALSPAGRAKFTPPASPPANHAVAAPEARADPLCRSRTRHPPRLRTMQTAEDTPRPDQQPHTTQTADHRRRAETPRRPHQAPAWAELSTAPANAPRTSRNAPKRNMKRLYNEVTQKTHRFSRIFWYSNNVQLMNADL